MDSGNKRYVIFGGDDVHAGGVLTAEATRRYQQFASIINNVLGTNILYRSSIGNWEDSTTDLFRRYGISG